ncbi:MAG TPA: hypothetical protein VNK43_09730, partial [Gemmatimonadales bacterium]|nr:hypothetical protein [Gemmatimonadales bacterium]
VPPIGAGRQAAPEPAAVARAAVELALDDTARSAARVLGARLREELGPARVAEVCEGWYREALGA